MKGGEKERQCGGGKIAEGVVKEGRKAPVEILGNGSKENDKIGHVQKRRGRSERGEHWGPSLL